MTTNWWSYDELSGAGVTNTGGGGAVAGGGAFVVAGSDGDA